MTNTTNYELNIVEGTDKVNPLTQLNPNFEIIDEQMKKNSDAGVQSATELTTGTVHALTRLQGDAPVFKFTATSRFTAGDTFTVDGVQVSALTTSGEQLPDGAYVIGAEVLCNLKGSVLTVYCSMNTVANAVNSQKLGGQGANYYATAEAVKQAQETATSAGNLASKNADDISVLNNKVANLLSLRGLSLGTISFTSPNSIKEITVDLSQLEKPIGVVDIIISSPTAGAQYINYCRSNNAETFRLYSTVAQNIQVTALVLCYK